MNKSTAAQQPEEHILSPSEDEHTTMSDVPTVTCTLCGAGYVPSPAHEDLKYAPEVVLESVLMRMCHFCFRCRRAACPECWDEVHGVCGSCVQEAGLPFRAEGAPFKSVAFSPVRQLDVTPAQDNTSSPMLVCVRPGCFQAELPVAGEPPGTTTVTELKDLVVAEGEKQDGSTTQTAANKKPKRPVAQEVEGEEKERGKRHVRFLRAAERLLTMVLLVVLLAIIGLIVLAEVSMPANTLIVRMLHVDIRQEVAYLLYVIRQLHW